MTFCCLSLHGKGWLAPEVQEKLEAIRNTEDETVLLENLKTYKTALGNTPDANWLYMYLSASAMQLAKIGSMNAVQVFLDDILWLPNYGEIGLEAHISALWRLYKTPMGRALMSMGESHKHNVPLRQCMGALMKSEDGTAEALVLEEATRRLHGKDFLREVERLAETSPDKERWEAMKKRTATNEILVLPFSDAYVVPEANLPRHTNDVEVITQNLSQGYSRVTIGDYSVICKEESTSIVIQRRLEEMQATYDLYQRYIAQKKPAQH